MHKPKHTALAALLAFALALSGLFTLPMRSYAAGTIVYVDAGANNGSSWSDAYPSLQEALAGAASGTEIWVAKGTYMPTSGSDRTATFQLKDGVAIYGGFASGETQRDQRNWQTNVIFTGNSANYGGGILTTGSNNLTLTNVTISGNTALVLGGGLYSENGSNPQVRNSIVWDNGSNGVYIGNDQNKPASVPVFSSSIVQGAGGSAAWSSTFATNTGLSWNTSSATDGGGDQHQLRRHARLPAVFGLGDPDGG